MTDLKKAAQQALNSLRGYRRELGCQQPCDAEQALETALEQPEQEPVAWRYLYSDGFWRFSNGERVNGCDPVEAQPLFTHPPRREWRGLTDAERASVQFESFKRGLSPLEFMELHEAKLKELNHE
jgi:hypothetical protein